MGIDGIIENVILNTNIELYITFYESLNKHYKHLLQEDVTMKKTNLVLKMSLAALMASSIGTATADVIDGTASANVITPLTVTETTALDFGTIAGGSTAGTVVMTSGGLISTTGGATFVPSVSNQATFDITGAVSTAILVTLTTAGAQLDDGAGAGAAMALGTFTNTALPVTTDVAGVATFDVGATLSVGINQGAGLYTTATAGGGVPYTVTVNYQ